MLVEEIQGRLSLTMNIFFRVLVLHLLSSFALSVSQLYLLLFFARLPLN